MKKAFLVGSIIAPDNAHPLTFTDTRSWFTPEIREMQTVATINMLDLLSDRDTTIYLLELSDTADRYKDRFAYQPNLKFINITHLLPEVQQRAKTDPNKSRGELLMLFEFLKLFKDEMKQYDYFIKLSGRYLLDSSFDMSLFNRYNTDKIFFKKANKWHWGSDWPYSFVDNRAAQQDNTLRFYNTVVFGWGRERHQQMMDMFIAMATILGLHGYNMLDIECLSYFFTRKYEDKMIETDWVQTGWQGSSGLWVRY